MVGTISGTTFISDSVLFLRDSIRSSVTDPISSKRVSGASFVMTSYPQRSAIYPLIIIKDDGISDVKRLGMQSEQSYVNIPIEVRVWARNIKERDELSQQVYNFLQKNQLGTGSETTNFGLHDFQCTSMINIDDVDENGKDSGIRTKQMRYNWRTII